MISGKAPKYALLILVLFAGVLTAGCATTDLKESSLHVEEKTITVRNVLANEGVSISESVSEGEYPCEQFSFLNSKNLRQIEFTVSGALPPDVNPEVIKTRVAAVLPPAEEVPVSGGVPHLKASDEWGKYILRFDPIGDIDAVSFRGVTSCGEPIQAAP